jgi:myo-inositol-1-phosphate synthase
MVNCMPVFCRAEPYWQKRFEEAGDHRGRHQVAGRRTISHRVLTTLFQDRGVHLDRTCS